MTYQAGAFRGAAALSWVDADDVNVERVLLLREPMRELRPAAKQAVYAADSLDFSQRQSFYIGLSVDELVGRVRFMDDPQGVMDLLKAGSKQRTIMYLPNLADPNRNFACYLVAPTLPQVLKMDATMGVEYGLREVELTLRQTNGKAFDLSWAYETGIFFRYVAGGRLKDAAFSRGSVAGRINKVGIFESVAAATARINWQMGSQGLTNGTLTLLLEAAATNKLTAPEDLSNAAWTKAGATIPSINNPSPRNSDLTASFLREDVSNGTHQLFQAWTASAAGNTAGWAGFVKANGRTKARLDMQGNGSANHFSVTIDLTAGTAVNATAGTSTLTFSEIRALGGGYFFVQMYGIIGDGTTARNFQIFLGDASGNLSYVGDGASGMLVWGCVATDNTIAGMYWGTGASRSSDSLTVPWNLKPQAGWFYVKFIEGGTVKDTTSRGVLGIGNNANTRLLLLQESGGGFYRAALPGNDARITLAAAPSVGDTVELLLTVDGTTGTLMQSINAGAQTSVSGAQGPFPQAWDDLNLQIGRAANLQGYNGIIAVKAGAGTAVNSLVLARAA